jgi:hypothetical protein
MSKKQSHSLQFFHEARAEAELALKKAQLALAQAETELSDAEAASNKEECPKHSQEREHHLKQRHSISLLTCQHCHHCAFCEPRFDLCWTGGEGGHLPRSKWDDLLDEMIAHPDVLNFLKGEGFKVGQKRKLRVGYCKHYCARALSGIRGRSEGPTPKRLCSILPLGTYIEQGSTDFWTPNDHDRLQKFNQLWSFPACLKVLEPIIMEQAQHKNNAYLRNQMHWYCEQVLDILSPGEGKALYSYICNIEIQHANQTTQTVLNSILDNLVELYLF